MDHSDCVVEEFRTTHGKYGVIIQHVPTGMKIEGNCGWVDKVPEVKAELFKRLAESVKDAPLLPPAKKIETREEILEQCAVMVEQHRPDLGSLAQAIRNKK